MNTREREAIRYLGYGKAEPDEHIKKLIDSSFQELEQIAEKKLYYQTCSLDIWNDYSLMIGTVEIKSKNLCKNLRGCKEVLVLGATLGTGVDRLLQKYERLDITRAVVLQACAAAYLEEFCDVEQKKLKEHYGKEGLYLRPRFSPGYGDFSLEHQKDILEILNAAKRIGLSMTESHMLIPTKSITAVIGISGQNEACHVKGCEACTKEDCMYRRS